MLTLSPGTKVHLAILPTDMRKGFDGLYAQANRIVGVDSFDGHLLLFRSKSVAVKERVKTEQLQIEKLRLKIDKLLRRSFGQSSERTEAELQGLLFSSEYLEMNLGHNQALLDIDWKGFSKNARR